MYVRTLITYLLNQLFNIYEYQESINSLNFHFVLFFKFIFYNIL